MNYNNLKKEDYIDVRTRFAPPPKKLEPKIDTIISKIVGRKIYQRDPRLIQLIIKWKKNKPADSMEPDNFLRNPDKIKELKQVLSTSL